MGPEFGKTIRKIILKKEKKNRFLNLNRSFVSFRNISRDIRN